MRWVPAISFNNNSCMSTVHFVMPQNNPTIPANPLERVPWTDNRTKTPGNEFRHAMLKYKKVPTGRESN